MIKLFDFFDGLLIHISNGLRIQCGTIITTKQNSTLVMLNYFTFNHNNSPQSVPQLLKSIALRHRENGRQCRVKSEHGDENIRLICPFVQDAKNLAVKGGSSKTELFFFRMIGRQTEASDSDYSKNRQNETHFCSFRLLFRE